MTPARAAVIAFLREHRGRAPVGGASAFPALLARIARAEAADAQERGA